MALEKVNFTVLVVDDDDTSLTIVANILSSWDYKVLTANSAGNALKTLREFEGFFDLVITEVHMSGMNEFEFQQRVKDEFQLPVIMMSTDSKKKEVMSKSLENEEALYLLKPVCADDLKDVWKYALAARKSKLVFENESRSSDGELPAEKIIIQDINSCAPSTVTHETKRKRKYTKKRSTEMNNKTQRAESYRVQKKPKIVWTTYLHNLFMTAIKQLGYDKAVPKNILEVMNVPYLTRENVASHLQKYRIFLRNLAERGILEGLSGRTLKSKFASGLTPSVIKEIQTRSEKLRVPVQQYLKSVAHESENVHTAYYSKLYNHGPFSPPNLQVQRSAYVTTELGRGQFPNAMYTGLVHQNQQAFNGYNSLNQVRLGQSSFGSNMINFEANEMQQKMLGSNANPVYNAGPNNFPIPSYGNGIGYGLMTSANGLTGSLSQNYGSPFGNQSFKYDLGNEGMTSLSNSNVPWNSSTCYPPRNNSYGIQLNGGPQMVGTGIKERYNNSVGTRATVANNYRSSFVMNGTQNANMHNNNSFGLGNGTQNANMHVSPWRHNNNSFGLVNGTQNANMHVGMEPLGQGNSDAGSGYVSELHSTALISDANSGNANAAGNEHQYNGSSIIDGEVNRLQDDLSELFLMVQNMELLNEMEETDVSEYLNSDFSGSPRVMQPPEQTATNVIVPPTESNINQQNESPSSSDKNPNQDSDKFVDWESLDRFWVDSVFSGSNSAIEQDWDMNLIEAFCGTKKN